jgi:hypothetical protein
MANHLLLRNYFGSPLHLWSENMTGFQNFDWSDVIYIAKNAWSFFSQTFFACHQMSLIFRRVEGVAW